MTHDASYRGIKRESVDDLVASVIFGDSAGALRRLAERTKAAENTLRHIATAGWTSLEANEVLVDIQALAEHRLEEDA